VLGERLRGLVQRCGDVLGLPVGMLIDDLVDAHPSGDPPQHGHDREAKAPDAGLAIHFVTLDRDAVVDLCAHRRSSQIPVVRVPTVAVSTLVDLCPSESHRICQPPPAVRLARRRLVAFGATCRLRLVFTRYPARAQRDGPLRNGWA
jgi:hypothetical protein